MTPPRASGPDDNDAYVREVHDKGLQFDLVTLSRRRLLGVVAGTGVLAVAGAQVWGQATPANAATCLEEIESETNGPYPADGTNGIDIRTTSGIVRQDIRTSLATGTTAQGVPLDIRITIQDLSCQPLVGAAVYVWHCDRAGNYSLYSAGITGEDYLRGVQETDSTGTVTFTSIFPACYAGRWPHIHFEVYASLADVTSGAGPIRKISQIAIPQDICTAVYATDGYSQSVTNLGGVSLATDNVFGDDNAARQLGTVTGTIATGLTVALTATIDPTATESSGSAPGGSPGGTPPSGAPSGPVPSGSPGGPVPSGAPSGSPSVSVSPSVTASPTSSPAATASPSPTASTSAAVSSSAAASASASATRRPTQAPKPAQQRRRRHWWWPF